MNNQPVLYDSLKTILHHMEANLRINMSQRMRSIRAIEKAVPLKMRYLWISDNTIEINDVRYKLGVYRNYPSGDIPQYVKNENAPGGVSHDFDRFGFEIPIGLSPILPGDVSVRNGNERVSRTDTDELEEHYQTELNRCEIILRGIAEQESGKGSWTEEYPGYTKDHFQYWVDHAREKLKSFHCRRHNLPPPFNCYIQLSTMKDGEANPLHRLSYKRTLYEAVKNFNHTLFANRPVIKVKVLECRAMQVYRIPVGLKISANKLTVKESQIDSIATMIEGDVNTLRVFRWGNAENWWQHSLVQNAKELITEDSLQAEKSCLMLRTFRNKIVRFHNLRYLTTEQYCKLIENWMSVKREVGSELWIGLHSEKHRNNVLTIIQTRMEVVRRKKRCVTILGKNGTRVEVCEAAFLDKTMVHNWTVKVKIIEN
ncbi:unnamed protein product [Caenorhabditis nigoni]